MYRLILITTAAIGALTTVASLISSSPPLTLIAGSVTVGSSAQLFHLWRRGRTTQTS